MASKTIKLSGESVWLAGPAIQDVANGGQYPPRLNRTLRRTQSAILEVYAPLQELLRPIIAEHEDDQEQLREVAGELLTDVHEIEVQTLTEDELDDAEDVLRQLGRTPPTYNAQSVEILRALGVIIDPPPEKE